MRAAALGAILMAAFSPAAARAQYCAFGDPYTNVQSVPVYVHQELASTMLHTDETPWTANELVNEVSWVLETVHESYANTPRFYYAGITSCPSGTHCYYANAVHLQPRLQPQSADDIEFCKSSGADVPLRTPAQGRAILFNRSNYQGAGAACNTRYEHWDQLRPLAEETYGRYVTFGSIMLHEMEHVLGVHHQRSCATVTCSSWPYCSVAELSPFFPQEAHQWFTYDVNAIQWRYGTSPVLTASHRESAADTWWSLPGANVPNFSHQADASSRSASMFMYTASVNSARTLRVHRWNWATFAWSEYGYLPLSHKLHRVGASQSASAVHAHQLVGETETNVEKTISEETFTAPYVSSSLGYTDQPTRIHGIESAYDPASLMRVLTWRSTTGAIQLQAVHPTLGYFAPRTLKANHLPVAAYGTPSVACADAETLNCILVWAGSSERGTLVGHPHYHVVVWVQFEVYPDDTYVFGLIRTTDITVHSPPRVSVDDSFPSPGTFVLAAPYSYPSKTSIWTARKSIDNAVIDWSGFIDHATASPGRVAFMLGGSNGYAELVYRRH